MATYALRRFAQAALAIAGRSARLGSVAARRAQVAAIRRARRVPSLGSIGRRALRSGVQ